MINVNSINSVVSADIRSENIANVPLPAW